MQAELLHALLAAGIKHGASDIHFRPGAPPMCRVNKQLLPLKTGALSPADTEAIALIVGGRLLAKEVLDEVQEFDVSYSLPGVARFRANIYRQRGSLALVMRIIPSEVPALETLSLPAVVERIAEAERGLVLVTGATGSGKSTTLAAMIRRINETRTAHILTIEDPIEFLHRSQRSSISQREIGLDTRNFVKGMRSALRQDPDVILVGEMRDPESIDIALKAAETGHVVFSTVHTTDASKTIGRLVSVFPAEEQKSVRLRLAENLRATISQRLLPRADGKGMVAAVEVMICTGSVREVIAERAPGSLKDLIEQGREHYRMQSFDQHLAELYAQGLITKEVAIHAASNPADFQRQLSFT
ncbi:MAG TPA: type IV pilus twitching motility protein PilT [Polyangiaceae bacterium]|jgi:twitching motility protein PilT|nr:type IV pilus twitching motility protein PilT [Polyangiaceae bacterium]